jgi:two-component system response regulator HupR/HoxA
VTKEILLVVDDQPEILNTLTHLFKRKYEVLSAISAKDALVLIEKREPAVVLSDQRMPQMDGVTFLSEVRKKWPDSVRILFTGYADIEATIEAVNKANIYQYVSKPFEPNELLAIVNGAAERFHLTKQNIKLQASLQKKNKQLKNENSVLHQQIEKQLDVGNMIGHSSAMLKVFSLIKKVADTPTTVLILGETGTGKELLARMIHYNSNRKDKMFVVQNCGAVPDTLLQSELFGHEKGSFTGAVQNKKGLFEQAHNGTIFLDEIGDTSPAFQLGLLRVLQENEIRPLGAAQTKKIDTRVLAATNKDLEKEVAEGRFREDLYYRLSAFPVYLPPLRERSEDIPDLLHFFIAKYSKRIDKRIAGINQDVLQYLMMAKFPGNIRELENEAERLVTMVNPGDEITKELLSERFITNTTVPVLTTAAYQDITLKHAVEVLERQLIDAAFRETKGNILQAANRLGISRAGLHKMIKRYEIEPAFYKKRV